MSDAELTATLRDLQSGKISVPAAQDAIRTALAAARKAGAQEERERLVKRIETDILPHWHTNGADGQPGIQWLSQAEWNDVATWIRSQGEG